jgi:hypothetical protein
MFCPSNFPMPNALPQSLQGATAHQRIGLARVRHPETPPPPTLTDSGESPVSPLSSPSPSPEKLLAIKRRKFTRAVLDLLDLAEEPVETFSAPLDLHSPRHPDERSTPDELRETATFGGYRGLCRDFAASNAADIVDQLRDQLAAARAELTSVKHELAELRYQIAKRERELAFAPAPSPSTILH